MCEKDEDFGMLVGFYDDYRSIKGPILLSFSKQVGKVFPKKCFVYYIVESEDDFVVSILDMVDNVPYIYMVENCNFALTKGIILRQNGALL